MQVFLLLALILVPAPRIEQANTVRNPIVGSWAIDWGVCQQTTFFRPDGTCFSPEFGAGTWSIDDEGTIWFSERDGTAQYLMRVDLAEGGGAGWHWSQGTCGPLVEVKIRRGERLPAPRVVE